MANLDDCEPVFDELPGWPEGDIAQCTRFEDLPINAQAYVRRVEALAGVPARFVSVGPGREQAFPTPGSPSPAGLFASPTRFGN